MAEEIKPARPSFEQAASTAVTDDAATAELLRKHAANEKLSPREYGLLGVLAKKGKALFAGKGESAAQPNSGGNGNARTVGALAPAQASGDGLPAVPPDPRLVQNATALILSEANKAVERFIGSEARKAGADAKSETRIVAAASLPATAKNLMVETSPEVARILGLSPEHFPLGVFFGALGLWGTNLTLTVMELRELRKAPKPEKKPEPESKPAQTTIKTPVLPKSK